METSVETYDANIRIRDLPKSVDESLNKIATRKGLYKWEVVRDALAEYVEKHSVTG